MATVLENKLSNLIFEIKEIKKELIVQETNKRKFVKNKFTSWKTLGKKISSKWDDVSAGEEITHQREKTW